MVWLWCIKLLTQFVLFLYEQLEGHTEKIDAVEYAQAPCTPGLLEEPNLSKTQEASVCDDQLELGEEPNFVQYSGGLVM